MKIYIIVAIIIVVLLVYFIKNMNYQKVVGRIIAFEEEDNKHYPIFEFETLDSQKIVTRNRIGDIEACVEEAYTLDHCLEYLKKPLPIENIVIKYNKKNLKIL